MIGTDRGNLSNNINNLEENKSFKGPRTEYASKVQKGLNFSL